MPKSFVRIAVGGKELYSTKLNQMILDYRVRNVIKVISNILIIRTFLGPRLAILRLLKNFKRSIRSQKLSLAPNKHN